MESAAGGSGGDQPNHYPDFPCPCCGRQCGASIPEVPEPDFVDTPEFGEHEQPEEQLHPFDDPNTWGHIEQGGLTPPGPNDQPTENCEWWVDDSPAWFGSEQQRRYENAQFEAFRRRQKEEGDRKKGVRK